MFCLMSSILILLCSSQIAYVELASMPNCSEITEEDEPAFRIRQSRSVLIDQSSRWPILIQYKIDSKLNRKIREMIEDALGDFSKYTCLSFEPVAKKKAHHLYFIHSNKGSKARIGMGRVAGKHKILLDKCCATRRTVLHEVLHALGFKHEHERYDRDEYITINYDNIIKEKFRNFRKEDPKQYDTQDLPYDIDSVMHYSAYAFSKNGLPTITAKDSSTNWKRVESFSIMDIERINRAYCKHLSLLKAEPECFPS